MATTIRVTWLPEKAGKSHSGVPLFRYRRYVQYVLKNVPVYTNNIECVLQKWTCICKRKIQLYSGTGWNELHADNGHATMSGMNCMFGLDMQLDREGLHVGVGHATR